MFISEWTIQVKRAESCTSLKNLRLSWKSLKKQTFAFLATDRPTDRTTFPFHTLLASLQNSSRPSRGR